MRTTIVTMSAAIALATVGAGLSVAPVGAAPGVGAPSVLGGPGHALVYASGMEIAPDGTLVVADTGNDSVAKFRPNGTLMWRVAAGVAEGDEAENARDIAVDGQGNIYVADAAEFRIIKLDPNGKNPTSFNGPAGDRLGSPIGITAKNNKIYVSDGAKKKVRVFDTAGVQLQTFAASGACDLSAVRDADADAAGNVYVANYKNNNIVKFAPDGTCLTTWGSQGTANGQFKNPYGVRLAKDPKWGEVVYVADSNNNRIRSSPRPASSRRASARAACSTSRAPSPRCAEWRSPRMATSGGRPVGLAPGPLQPHRHRLRLCPDDRWAGAAADRHQGFQRAEGRGHRQGRQPQHHGHRQPARGVDVTGRRRARRLRAA